MDTAAVPTQYTEWQARVELAALYRLVAHYGWDDLNATHISMRLPGPDNHFLINPYGVLFEQVTPKSLVKIDVEGRKVDTNPAPVNPAGFVIHSAIHQVRADAHCVLHVHTSAGVAVSAQRQGLLPISQHALLVLGTLSYHDYEGVALDLDEKDRLQQHLGDNNAMMLRNHGLLVVGKTPADAFVTLHILQKACEIQLRAQAGGADLIYLASELVERVGKQSHDKALRVFDGSLSWPFLMALLEQLEPGWQDK